MLRETDFLHISHVEKFSTWHNVMGKISPHDQFFLHRRRLWRLWQISGMWRLGVCYLSTTWEAVLSVGWFPHCLWNPQCKLFKFGFCWKDLTSGIPQWRTRKERRKQQHSDRSQKINLSWWNLMLKKWPVQRENEDLFFLNPQNGQNLPPYWLTSLRSFLGQK